MNRTPFQITNGFDKFAVVSDLSDHPSLKYKVTSHAGSSSQNQQQQNNGVERQSGHATSAASDRKPKVSINEIASALSRKSSPSQSKNGFCGVSGGLQEAGKHVVIGVCVTHRSDWWVQSSRIRWSRMFLRYFFRLSWMRTLGKCKALQLTENLVRRELYIPCPSRFFFSKKLQREVLG